MVGVDPFVFWNELSSSPPLGWPVWLAAASLGAGLICAFGLFASFGSPKLRFFSAVTGKAAAGKTVSGSDQASLDDAVK